MWFHLTRADLHRSGREAGATLSVCHSEVEQVRSLNQITQVQGSLSLGAVQNVLQKDRRHHKTNVIFEPPVSHSCQY